MPKEIDLDNLYYAIDIPLCRVYKILPDMLYGKMFHKYGNSYANVHNIVRMAERRGVPPEILVNEAYYYKRCQMAPYRLAFHIIGKWGTIENFYSHLEGVHKFVPGKRSVRDLLRGNLYELRDVRFWVVDKFCRLAGMPMAYLFTPYRRKGTSPVYSALIDVMSGLDECDVAALAGFAKLLVDGDVSLDDVRRLLEWHKERKVLKEPNTSTVDVVDCHG